MSGTLRSRFSAIIPPWPPIPCSSKRSRRKSSRRAPPASPTSIFPTPGFPRFLCATPTALSGWCTSISPCPTTPGNLPRKAKHPAVRVRWCWPGPRLSFADRGMLGSVPDLNFTGFTISGAAGMNPRFTPIALAALFVFSLTSGALAQDVAPGPRAAVDGQSAPVPGVKFLRVQPMSITAHPDFLNGRLPAGRPALSAGSKVTPSLDTVPLFSRSFFSHGLEWPYTMIGGEPSLGRATHVPTKIVFVSLELQNADLTTTTLVPIGPFERKILNSPNFQETDYASGEDIQFGDAVQRAEFFHAMKDNWHTELRPVETVERITIKVPRFVTVDVNGTPTNVRAYFRGTADDGSVVVVLLDRF